MIGGKILRILAKGEKVLHVFKRHPIGLIWVYSYIVFGSIISYVVIKNISDSGELGFFGFSSGIWTTVAGSVIGFIILTGWIGRQVYWANELIVTEENLIQILRPSLLHRDVAQLNLGKIQDVSVDQRGFFQLALGYGTLIIETAGEVASYRFAYAKKPNEMAAKIMQAHDKYLAKRGRPKAMYDGGP